MSSTTSRPGGIRFSRAAVAAAGVAVLAAATIVSPSAASDDGPPPTVSITTTVNGVLAGPAFTAEPATVAFKVTNNSTRRKLGAYTIVVPPGMTPVVNSGVSLGTWNQSIASCGFVPNCGSLVLVSAKTSTAMIGAGASVTSSIQVTPATAGVKQFPFIGIGGGIFTVSGPKASVTVVDGTATDLLVSIVGPVVKNEPAAVTVASVREYPDGSGSYTPKPFPAALSFATGIAPDAVIGTVPDLTGQTSVTFDATFGAVQVNPLQSLTVTSGPASGSTSFPVVAAGIVSSDPLVVLNGEGGTYTAKLNPLNGPVTFTEVPCDAIEEGLECDTEVNLNGSFKDPDTGAPLYTFGAPASIEWTCPAAQCPATPRVYGQWAQDQEVDFDNYKIQVSLLVDGVYTDFADAEPCNLLTDNEADALSGVITLQSAKDAGFCADVYGITRAGGALDGDLTIPILFVEDPKLRGI